MKIISTNKKAYLNYEILETFEAGIELKGSEVKSLRLGRVNIQDSYAYLRNGEIRVSNMHISEFDKTSYFKEDPYRERKLLLHKKEIHRLWGLVSQKGFTLVPLKVYFTEKGLAKLEIGLGKGRRIYDKRKAIKERDEKRYVQRTLRRFNR